MPDTDLIEVVVSTISRETADVNVYELRRKNEAPLPLFSAGAHIVVHLLDGMVRSYSLCNSQAERDRYVIAVARSTNVGGRSGRLHDTVKVGDTLKIGAPHNNFPLKEDAHHTVLIAGGIGVTPIWCMAQRLQQLGRSWELIYCTRSRDQTAFLQHLSAPPYAANVRFNFDAEPGGEMLDIGGLVQEIPESAHVYCCGPTGMLNAFEDAARTRVRGTAHLERFSAVDAPATSGGFTVKLARTGKEVQVAKGKTVLDALLEIKIQAPYSCLEGTCGECLTKVLSGVPDHRDVYLSDEEHAANDKMTICCSGSKTDCLVLDL